MEFFSSFYIIWLSAFDDIILALVLSAFEVWE